jgi:hypothetical protein
LVVGFVTVVVVVSSLQAKVTAAKATKSIFENDFENNFIVFIVLSKV